MNLGKIRFLILAFAIALVPVGAQSCSWDKCDGGFDSGDEDGNCEKDEGETFQWLTFPMVKKCCLRTGPKNIGCPHKWKKKATLCAGFGAVSSVPANAVPENGFGCWQFKCKDGYEYNSDKTGCQKKCDAGQDPSGDTCVINLTKCTEANGWVNGNNCEVCTGGKKPVGNTCKFPLGPNQGYNPNNPEIPMECSTKKHASGEVFQKVIDDMCVQCLDDANGKKYIKTESAYIAGNGNCASIRVSTKEDLLVCARESSTDAKFLSCLQNRNKS